MRTVVSCVAYLVLVGCAVAPRFDGRIEKGRFYDPEGRFSIQIPHILHGAVTAEGRMGAPGGNIGFLDGHGRLIRVDVFTAIDQESRAFINAADWKAPFHRNRQYYAELFQSLFPSVSLVHQEYMRWNEKHADYFVFELENGSSVMDARTRKRLDALRASLSFVHGDSIYLISMQHTPGVDSPKDDKDMTPIIKRLRTSLEDVADTIQFGE